MTTTTKSAPATKFASTPDNWYYLLYANAAEIADYVAASEGALKRAREQIALVGCSIVQASAMLPPLVESTYHQWHEAEAILEMLRIQLSKVYKKEFKEFSGKHDIAMSTRDMKQFIEGEPDVVAKREEINTVAYIRNQWEGVMKAFESKQYQVSNITRMRAAGIEDSAITF